MPVVSSIFLVAALVMAVVFGPQTRPWTWGPALLCLSAAVLAGLPALWRRGRAPADVFTMVIGLATLSWFAWRAWFSPVAELGRADLLLAGAAAAAFVSVRAITGHLAAERTLIWGIALLLLASLVVAGIQIADPTYIPVFRSKPAVNSVTGFFGHYNYGANFLLGSAVIVGAAAFCGAHRTPTRWLFVVLALAAVAGIWFSRSRGGLLAAAVAMAVFAVMLLVIGKQRDAKWFGLSLIALPLVGIGAACFLLQGWTEAQELRQAGSTIEQLVDNDFRLYMLGVALSCVGLHPLQGGGARSFSWECFQFIDLKAHGAAGARPEMVHNELVQAATDYGLFGVGLLLGLMVLLIVASVLRLAFDERGKDRGFTDCWRLAGLAGLVGLLVHSCFSFVFHLLPGVLLLGILLGMLSRSRPVEPGARSLVPKLALTLAGLAVVIMLIPSGWAGTRVTRALWPTHYGKVALTSAEARHGALSEAIRLWPHSSFYQDRAVLLYELAGDRENPDFAGFVERAADDYQAAAELHPFQPGYAVNLAGLLSQLGRDREAEEAYRRAIQLQGGMEPAFRGSYYASIHYLTKGLRLFEDDAERSLEALELAAEFMEEAAKVTPPWVIGKDGQDTRVSIHESLGTAREAVGDREGALQSYDFAASLPGGLRAHHRAGLLLGRIAADAWFDRRPSEAMRLFLRAKQRVGQAGGQLPAGVSGSDRIEYLAYLDRVLDFLKGAKITPDP